MRKNTFIIYIYGFLSFIALWFLLSIITDIPIIPSPFAVLSSLGSIFLSEIAIHGLYSIGRIAGGVFIAIVLGVPLGLSMGYFIRLDKILSPIVYLSYPVPKIALLPIVMLLLGLGEISKITMIVLIVIFQIIIGVRDSVKSIPEEIYYPLYSLGAGNLQIFKEIIVPASLPKLLTSLRVGMATAISVLFFTETFGTQHGMGYFIMDAWVRYNYVEMYSGIIVLSLIGLLNFLAIDILEEILCPWR